MMYSTRTVKCVFAVIVFILVLGIAFCIGMAAKAGEEENKENLRTIKCYCSIEVESGDTFWSIAQEYCPDDCSNYEFIQEVKKINHLGSTLYAGNRIMIPAYYSVAR